MLEIYVHIPFCRAKCGYCDFNSFPPAEGQTEKYVKRLIKEIAESPYRGEKADTIFIGGGTPSLISPEYISEILKAVNSAFPFAENCEITMEANPESISPEGLKIYKNAGVNRISMGVQSFNDSELKTLGRIHNSKQAVEAYNMIRKAGFKNINIDLMFCYPSQSLESWEKSLYKAVELNPEHISAYSLIIEENTLFYKKYKNFQTNEDLYRIMYRKTKEILEGAGYHRYEFSNLAKEGYECRHNIGYWKRYNYLGFGLSAHSMYNNVRFSNTDSLSEYLTGEKENYREVLAKGDIIGEFMFLGLRMTEGINLSEFRQNFGKDIFKIFGSVIEKYEKYGFLEHNKERLWLTEDGIDVSNTIFSDFLLD
ncbi:MAG: radical SAM family heme chaperone HemW [Clostridiales bacterium]|nr:radical SAM family heme chaperone HemW [Clostridiales bacterium]